jgi:hypothetical protein
VLIYQNHMEKKSRRVLKEVFSTQKKVSLNLHVKIQINSRDANFKHLKYF